jgi:hypothetical protein
MLVKGISIRTYVTKCRVGCCKKYFIRISVESEIYITYCRVQ